MPLMLQNQHVAAKKIKIYQNVDFPPAKLQARTGEKRAFLGGGRYRRRAEQAVGMLPRGNGGSSHTLAEGGTAIF